MFLFNRSLSANSRRFTFFAAALLIANALGWMWYIHTHDAKATDLLRVERFEPAGNLLTSGQRPTMLWQFNLDIADRDPNRPPVSIAPNIAGKFEWTDSRTLRFVPSEPLPPATQWRMALDAQRIASTQGFHLPASVVRNLHTESVIVQNARQCGFENDCAHLQMQFSETVLPADVQKRLSASINENHDLPLRVTSEQPAKEISVIVGPLPPAQMNTNLTLTLDKGLAAHGGSLASETVWTQAIPISTQLQLLHLEAESRSDGQCMLHMEFNGIVTAENLKKILTIEPSVPSYRFAQGQASDMTIVAPFVPGTRYAVRLVDAPKESDAKLFPKPGVMSAFVRDLPPGVGLENDDGYLGSAGRRTLRGYATNVNDVKVRIVRLYDNNIVIWSNQHPSRWSSQLEGHGQQVAEKTLHLGTRRNVRQPIELKLDDLLPRDAQKEGIYEISLSGASPAGADDDDDDHPHRYRRYYGRQNSASTIVTLSDIALSAKVGQKQLTAVALSLSTAKSLGDTHIRVFSNKNQLLGQGATGADGCATIALLDCPNDEHPSVMTAERKIDGSTARSISWLELSDTQLDYSAANTSGRQYLRKGYEAFVYSTRGVFRPGESVPLRAVIRGAEGALPTSFPVQWTFIDPRGREHDGPTGLIDVDGAFATDFKLPETTLTGAWRARIGMPGRQSEFGQLEFQVEDFIPDRLKVQVAITDGKSDKPLQRSRPDAQPAAKIHADYLFGQPGASLPVKLQVSAEPMHFKSEQWAGWTFGDAGNSVEAPPLASLRRQLPEESSSLDRDGTLLTPIDLDALLSAQSKTPRFARNAVKASSGAHHGPWRVNVEASVLDVSGRALVRSASMIVDPDPSYLGLHTLSTSSVPGATVVFNAAAVRPDSAIDMRASQLSVAVFRESWNNSMVLRNGRYVFESTRVLDACKDLAPAMVQMSDGKAEFTFRPEYGGRYVLVVRDPATKQTVSRVMDVISSSWQDSVSRENPEKLEVSVVPWTNTTAADWLDSTDLTRFVSADLVKSMRKQQHEADPAKHLYAANEWANVLVKSPFAGTLVLTLETDNVVEHRIVQMDQSHACIPIQLSAGCRPNVYISASVVRKVDPNVPWRPHRAYGITGVRMDQSDRQLDIAIQAPREIRPNQSLPVKVNVLDHEGKAVKNAAVTVAAVDEGICQLTDYRTPDPYAFFTAKRALAVCGYDVYSQLIPDGLRGEKTGDTGGDGDVSLSRYKPPVSARRVKPTALFSQVLHTDENGNAQADFPLPQFAGQLRLMAIASQGATSGSCEESTLVRSPIVVQANFPRFAAPGDAFEVPVSIFNTSSNSGNATVRLDISGPMKLSDASAEQTVMLSGNGRQTVVFHVSAQQAIGVAQLSASATLLGEVAADSAELPIRPASACISTGGAITLKPDSPAELSVRTDMLGGTGCYSIMLSPKPNLILPDGLDYLNRYPYGCCEQTTSTLFPLLALRDLGDLVDGQYFDASSVDQKIEYGLHRLMLMQRSDGGLSMWPGGETTWRYGSIYAAHFVVSAENAGYKVSPAFRDRLLGSLRTVLASSDDSPSAVEEQAYACYVLALANRADRAAMARLSDLLSRKPVDDAHAPTGPSRFLLAAALLASDQRAKAMALVPQIFPAISDARTLSGHLSSPARDRAIILSSLLSVQVDHPAIPKLAEEIAAMGRRHQWQSTHDIALSLVALAQYQRTTREQKPFEQAELLRGGEVVASSRNGQALRWKIDSANDTDAQKLSLRITGPAESRGFLTWIQTGVPMAAPPEQNDRGIKLQRRLLSRDGSTELNPLRLSTGQLVRVEIVVSADRDLSGVAIEDILPAGLEIENPRLSNSAKDSTVPNSADEDHEIKSQMTDIRDDRLVLITDLPAGTSRYSYLARAVTVGQFVMPPLRAECMYDMNTAGWTGTGKIVVQRPVVVTEAR